MDNKGFSVLEAVEQLKSLRTYGECYTGTVKVGEIIDLIEGQQAEIEKLKKQTLEKAQGLAIKTIFSMTAEHKKKVDQAAKNTAKEIYCLLVGEYEAFIPAEIANEIAERYGVEVE